MAIRIQPPSCGARARRQRHGDGLLACASRLGGVPRVMRTACWMSAAVALAACSGSAGSNNDDSGGQPGSSAGGSGQNAGSQGQGTTGSDGGPADAAKAGTSASADASTEAQGADASTSAHDASTSGDAANGTAPDGSASTSLVYPTYAGSGTIADGVAQLNLYRTLVGLNPVTLDSASSAACAAHLEYLVCAEASKGTGYLEHTETGVPSCAVDGGEPGGIDSDLAWGQGGSGNGSVTDQSLGQAVDLWINGLYHRNPLLDPGLTKVGAASTGGYNCLDYGATGNTVTVRAASPVLFPPDGTTNVPETFGGFESPCPTAADPLTATTCGSSGFIATANWYGWSNGNASAISAVSSATITDTATDAVVPLFAYYADTVSGHDPAPGYVHNEIALVPQASLAANHTFSVTIDATISGQTTTVSWTFTTGTRVAPTL